MEHMDSTDTTLHTLEKPAGYGDRNGASPRHLSALLPALTAAIGAPIPTPLHASPAATAAALGLPRAASAILVLADGMGLWNIARRRGHAPYLRALMDDPVNARPLRTCFPATTVAAMGTLGTGTSPGMTGMTGYTQLNTETGAISQMIAFRNAIPPERLQKQPTIFSRLSAQGVRVTSVGLPRFADSALTRAAFAGADYRGSKDSQERIALAAEAARRPGLTYVYTNACDKAGHTYGWESPQWVAAFEEFDANLRALRAACPPGTLLVVTADHGMVSSDPAERVDIAAEPALARGVRLVGGEPRAPMLYLEPDADPRDVAGRWRERLGESAEVLTRDEAISRGLYGPVRDDVRPMIGDVVVAAQGHATICDSRVQEEKAMRLPGVHGSHTAMETDIPLLIDVV